MATPQPQREADDIIRDLRAKRDRGEPANDMDRQRALRAAQRMSASVEDSDGLTAYVYSHWRLFDEADKATARLINKWGKTPRALVLAKNAYIAALNFRRSLDCTRDLYEESVGNVKYLRALHDDAVLAGAFFEAKKALDEMERIGMQNDEIPLDPFDEERQFLTEIGVDDKELVNYFDSYINVAKPFLKGRVDMIVATSMGFRENPETGEREFMLNLAADIDGKTASDIDWAFCQHDASEFSSAIRDNTQVNLILIPKDRMREMQDAT